MSETETLVEGWQGIRDINNRSYGIFQIELKYNYDLRFGSCGSFSFTGSMTPRFVPVRVCRFVSVRGHTVYNITCMHIHFICIDVVF